MNLLFDYLNVGLCDPRYNPPTLLTVVTDRKTDGMQYRITALRTYMLRANRAVISRPVSNVMFSCSHQFLKQFLFCLIYAVDFSTLLRFPLANNKKAQLTLTNPRDVFG